MMDIHNVQELETIGKEITVMRILCNELGVKLADKENEVNVLKANLKAHERNLDDLKRQEDRVKKILTILPR